jgi:hypothetical protein
LSSDLKNLKILRIRLQAKVKNKDKRGGAGACAGGVVMRTPNNSLFSFKLALIYNLRSENF